MSDQQKQQNDEYQYPQEEYVVESPTEKVAEAVASQPKQNPIMRFISLNKRKVLVIGIVVILLITFQVMRYERDNKVIKATPAVVAKPVPQPQVTTNSANTADQALLQQSLSNLAQNGNSNREEIRHLKNQLSNLNAQMQQANATNQQLKQAMVLLLQELQNINQHLQQQPAAKPAGLPTPKLTYYIRAIVPGRAWIISSNGLTETVTIGDPIPGYGIVTNIQANSGIITTNSGKKISLGLNDF